MYRRPRSDHSAASTAAAALPSDPSSAGICRHSAAALHARVTAIVSAAITLLRLLASVLATASIFGSGRTTVPCLSG